MKITSAAGLVLLSALSTAPALGQGTSVQRAACTPDVFRLCSGEIPNVDRITACLRRDRTKLSSGCQAVFAMLEDKKVATRSVDVEAGRDTGWCVLGENPVPGQELWIAWCSQQSRQP
ncbi:hypothetical protein [Methylobacterium sp. J-078]|uniref:hypothetical protein n=1 Tax=Methylobacterium sp. J-078 TaxID=2836657 RepID=UPI0039190EDD